MENTQVGGSVEDKVETAGVASETKRPGGVPRIKILLAVFGILFLALVGMVAVKQIPEGGSGAAEYTLVPDKISQSAPITIEIPEEVSLAAFDPSRAITFSPEIAGTWKPASADSPRVFRFLPAKQLALGTYYRATLETPEMKLEKMFSVDTDPSIIAVFPRPEAEVSEYGNITIIFSRPMVPLSTLSENADITPPVTITPPTDGRYKWITTKMLQFTPEERLQRSSRYTVSANTGFVSIDGLPVPPYTHTFTTRTLNYLPWTQNGQLTLMHDEPFRVRFNQPIDLERTKEKIVVTDQNNVRVSTVAAYGTRSVADERSGKEKILTDRSILEVYPEEDRNGRKFLWDFNTTYSLALSGAVPAEGDVGLETPFSQIAHVPEVITNMSAESPRSNLVSPQVFDPEGSLRFSIAEPIDLENSAIEGKGITKIAYGEKCREPAPGEEMLWQGADCEKVPDQSTIVVTFDKSAFTTGETSSVMFQKLVNTNGITLTTEPIARSFTTYKKFEIVASFPAESNMGAPLDHIKICSTNPVARPEEDDFYDKVRANMMIGLWNWDNSRLVTEIYSKEEHCPIGTFETTIRYGLVPKFAYELTLDLNDHFGQHLLQTLKFTTKDADPLQKGFVHMQPSVLMTPPTRTTLTYGLDFMREGDITVCKVSAETMLSFRKFTPKATAAPESLPCIETRTKHIELPESYATRKYFRIDIKDYFPSVIGNYVVVFSNPEYKQVRQEWDPVTQKYKKETGELLHEKTYVTVTRLAVAAKQAERGGEYYYRQPATDPKDVAAMKNRWPTNLYWVNDALSLSPSEYVTVTQYTTGEKTITKHRSATTDTEGVAMIPSADNVIGAVVANGPDAAVISNRSDSFSWAEQVSSARHEYIYTDRPLYRPGDTVHIKGISRIGYDGAFDPDTGSTSVSVRGPASEVPMRKGEVPLSKNGTYEYSFTLDSNAPLGYYSIESGNWGYGSFRVEEYVAPDFKIDLSADKEEYISGDTATVNVSANYYFGVPVERGEASYRIVAQDYYFDRYTDEYFNFGRGWYERSDGWYGDKYLSSGKVEISKAGQGAIPVALDLDKLFTGSERGQSKLVTVHVTVKNENGQSVSSQKSFIVHRGTFYAGLSMSDYFFSSGKKGIVRVKTVDTEGAPLAKDDLELMLEKVEWKSYKRQEVDGNFYYRTERTTTKVSTVTLDTNGKGDGSHEFTAGEAGEYRFTVTGKDGRGNMVSAQYEFYVSGRENVSVRETNNATLELVAEKTDVKVGDTASLVIKSPYPKAKALITVAAGKIYTKEIIDLSSQITRYQFTVTEAMIPNVVAEVLLLSPDPEVKFGSVYYSINTKEKELAITITPDKKNYLPGETVKLSVDIKDSLGRPVVAEVSLAVVNMNVLALAGNPKKNPVQFFYGRKALTIRTSSNVKNILNVPEIPAGTKGGSGGGGDELEKKARGVFRDTAYWEGSIVSGSDGKAHVEFALPDNLTEWQVEGVGITPDTKTGAGYASFVSRKTIMALPLKPRFIVPGDTFAVGGTVFNESEEKQTLDVSVVSPTLAFSGATHSSVTIPPHSSVSISFPASAPDSFTGGSHSFTFTAKNTAYEDSVTNTFPVRANNTYESTATAGRVSDKLWSEQLFLPKNVLRDRGSLSISLSATMASVLDEAIRGLIIYPYECSEQVASKLRTIALVKENAALFGTTSAVFAEKVTLGDTEYSVDELVVKGLAKLYQNQRPDGGVSFYPDTPPSYWLTLSTLETYTELAQAGYTVDKMKLTQAAQYVSNWITHNNPVSPDDVIHGAYALFRSGVLPANQSTNAKLLAYAKDENLIKQRLSTPALSYLAILSAKKNFGQAVTGRLLAEFENRSRIDARGTTVSTSIDGTSGFYGNGIANTALALKAFSETKHESPLTEGFVRAIKNSRAKDGGWYSTYYSTTVIDAFLSYLRWKDEGKAHVNVVARVDGDPVLDVTFSQMNIEETYATTLPMTALKQGTQQTVSFTKKDPGGQNDAYYYDMLLKYFLPADSIPPRDEGFAVERALYKLDDTEFARPVTTALQGDVLRGRVIITTPSRRSNVTIEDFIPAGTEIINQDFATEDQTLGGEKGFQEEMYRYRQGSRSPSGKAGTKSSLAQILSFGKNAAGPRTDTDGVVPDDEYGNKDTHLRRLYPSAVEKHDDRIFAYVSSLEPGVYVYEYFVRALVPGTYAHLPLIVSELYTPENFGRTKGETFTVTKKSE